MFNNTTVIIIIILLLLIYLFDNIKELEDKILSNPNVKTEHLHPRRKYFRDILLKVTNNHKKEQVIVKDIPMNNTLHIPGDTYISPENRILIPSEDKFISGVSAPGSTTMIVEKFNETELPVYMNSIIDSFK